MKNYKTTDLLIENEPTRIGFVKYISYLCSNVICFVFFSLFCFMPASAKLFKNNYVSFELPAGWDCELEKTEWTCQGRDVARSEAIIIFTAKEVGESDSLAQYLVYLKSPKRIMGVRGQIVTSTVQDVRRRKINHHDWVDGRHLSSEIPNYHTRYLATTKKNVAVLVTFSARKSIFTKYSHAFIRAINSLQIITTDRLSSPSGLSSGDGGTGGYGGVLTGNVQSAFPLDMYGEGELPPEPDAKKRQMRRLLLLLLLGIGCIVVYFFLARGDD